MIDYAIEPALDPDEMIDIFNRSGLAQRRPMHNRAVMEQMAAGANLIVTARDQDGRMVGLARSVTDFAYCVYVSDLATDQDYQGQGIGTRLLAMTHEAVGPVANLILISAPGAMDFYAKIGLEHSDKAWIQRGGDRR